MVNNKQVIRELQVSGKVKSSDASLRKYCLLDLDKNEGTAIGPMINLGTYIEPKWFIYKIAKKFRSKKDAEKYARDNKIEIVNWAIVD